jgi:hypothetical protein
MLKSFLIFKRNGAHLVEKRMFEKIRIVHFQGLSALNMQKHFKFVSKFEPLQLMENIPKNFMTIQTICLPCDLSNI